MKKLLTLLAFATAVALSGQNDTVYALPGHVVVYPPGAKVIFNDTTEFKGQIKTPSGFINAAELGQGSGGSAVVNAIITNGDSLHDGNANYSLYKYSSTDDTVKVSCNVTGDSLETSWRIYNVSTGLLEIEARVCNLLNGEVGLNLSVPPGRAILIRKTALTTYISIPRE